MKYAVLALYGWVLAALILFGVSLAWTLVALLSITVLALIAGFMVFAANLFRF